MPDQAIISGYLIVYKSASDSQDRTRFNSIILVIENLTFPVRRIFGIPNSDVVDPPEIMAQYHHGFKNAPKFYHYPSSIYADSFLGFGVLGVFVPVFWSLLLTLIFRLFCCSIELLICMTPILAFTVFTLMRGAPAIAFSQFTHVVYVILLIFVVTAILYGRRVTPKD